MRPEEIQHAYFCITHCWFSTNFLWQIFSHVFSQLKIALETRFEISLICLSHLLWPAILPLLKHKEEFVHNSGRCSIRIELTCSCHQHGPGNTSKVAQSIGVHPTPYRPLPDQQSLNTCDNSLFAHSFMALRASLKLSCFGTKLRIASVTLQPFRLRTLWGSRFLRRFTSNRFRFSGITASASRENSKSI